MCSLFYIHYLGIVSLRSAALRETPLSVDMANPVAQPFSARHSLAEGFFCNVLNPKAVIFYMAFLPQFIDPTGSSALTQSLSLAGIHFVIAMIWQCMVASLVDRAKLLFVRQTVRRGFDGLTGVVMMALGLKLVLDR